MFASGESIDPYQLLYYPGFGTGNADLTGKTQVDPRLVIGETTGVFVLLGQSNGGNYAQDASYVVVNAKVHNLSIIDGGVYRAGGSLLGCGGIAQNMWTRLGDRLITDGKYVRVILVPIEIGGSFCADWAAGGSLNHRIPVVAKRLAALGLTATAVFWLQGEGDTSLATSQAAYTASLNSVISTFRGAGITSKFFPSLTTYLTGTTSTAIRAAQAAVCNGTDIIQGPDTDTLDSSNRYDNLHWNSTGAAACAALWETVVLAHL